MVALSIKKNLLKNKCPGVLGGQSNHTDYKNVNLFLKNNK